MLFVLLALLVSLIFQTYVGQEVTFFICNVVSLYRNLTFLSYFVRTVLITAKYQCFCRISSDFVKQLKQVNPCFSVFHKFFSFPFDPSHIRNQFELNSFPAENPSKFYDPFFSSSCTCELQNLYLIFFVENLIVLNLIVVRIVINPKNYIFFECDR